jgi:hypothetical protein
MTKKEAETYLKRLELQYSMQTEGKKKSIGEWYTLAKGNSFKGRVKEAAIAAYGPENIVPEFQETTSQKMLPVSEGGEFEFNDDAVGIIFIETDTNKAYTFNSQGKKVPIING